MQTFWTLTWRNIKLFFKDKGMFFASLITPAILLVLYVTFLANVYKDSFTQAIVGVPLDIPDRLINGTVAAQLLSSMLAVIPVTVAFNSNMRLVQDKVSEITKDFHATPVRNSVLALSYFVGTLFATLIVGYVTVCLGLAYSAVQGWYFSFVDILLVAADVFLLSLLGTSLSSLISCFINSEGARTAVATLVSSAYGFLCGAYMPIASFNSGLQNALMFLPGTYGTALIRNHTMQGVFREMLLTGFPAEAVESIKDGLDCNIYFFGNNVETGVMYAVVSITSALLVAAYIAIYSSRKRR